MTAWVADCDDCEFVEYDEHFGKVYEAGRDHVDATGHDISGGRADP